LKLVAALDDNVVGECRDGLKTQTGIETPDVSVYETKTVRRDGLKTQTGIET